MGEWRKGMSYLYIGHEIKKGDFYYKEDGSCMMKTEAIDIF